MDEIEKYQKMKSLGCEPIDIYRAAIEATRNQIEAIRIMRIFFELSFTDAQKIAYKAETGKDFGNQEPDETLINEITEIIDEFSGPKKKKK